MCSQLRKGQAFMVARGEQPEREAAGHIVSPARKQRVDKEWEQGMECLGLSTNPLGPLPPGRAPPPEGSPAPLNNQRQGTVCTRIPGEKLTSQPHNQLKQACSCSKITEDRTVI